MKQELDVYLKANSIDTFKVIEWIDALRSGKYKQGRGMLHNSVTNEYCCLGVACELFKFKSSEENSYIDEYDIKNLIDGVIIFKNDAVDMDFQLYLSILNDTDGYTFEQIADFLEELITKKL